MITPRHQDFLEALGNIEPYRLGEIAYNAYQDDAKRQTRLVNSRLPTGYAIRTPTWADLNARPQVHAQAIAQWTAAGASMLREIKRLAALHDVMLGTPREYLPDKDSLPDALVEILGTPKAVPLPKMFLDAPKEGGAAIDI